MDNRKKHIISELENNLEDTITFFRSMSPDELSVQVYQDGAQWTVKLVLAHFVTIERSMQWLFKDILSGGQGSPEDFDVERFNRTQPRKLDGLTIDELVEQFKSIREGTISIVRKMSENDLDREGRHAFQGHGKLERFIQWAYEHVQIHLKDIQNAL